MNKYLLSTIAWVESIAKKEVEKQGGEIKEVKDRMIVFSWNEKTMVRVNLWSRVANKLYMVLWEGNRIDNFDKLFDLIYWLDFKKLVNKNYRIVVKVKSLSSELTSVPAIQKIWKKAIIDSITWKSGENVVEDDSNWTFEVMVLLVDNQAYILLNTSWDALHKRWYRMETWEAPVKESLAAALVLLSSWRFKEPFYDIFCWSGTIAIEAAMIARNIAPWLNRYFAFEKLWLVSKEMVEEEIKEAKKKEFPWNYNITASDIDDDVLNIAKENAKDAWVLDTIKFEKKDASEYLDEQINWTLVSNPPYGVRLNDVDLRLIYNWIDKLFRLNKELKWWVITSYEEFDSQINLSNYKKRKLYNGWERCYFYKRK